MLIPLERHCPIPERYNELDDILIAATIIIA
jgi:hypothetical protein